MRFSLALPVRRTDQREGSPSVARRSILYTSSSLMTTASDAGRGLLRPPTRVASNCHEPLINEPNTFEDEPTRSMSSFQKLYIYIYIYIYIMQINWLELQATFYRTPRIRESIAYMATDEVQLERWGRRHEETRLMHWIWASVHILSKFVCLFITWRHISTIQAIYWTIEERSTWNRLKMRAQFGRYSWFWYL